MKSLHQLHHLAGIAVILNAYTSKAAAAPLPEEKKKNVRSHSSQLRRFRRSSGTQGGNLDPVAPGQESSSALFADDLFAEEDAQIFGRFLKDMHSMSMPPPPPTTKRLTAAVHIPRIITTCFVGDECDGRGKEECYGLWEGGDLVEEFQPGTFQSVPESTNPSETYEKVKCLRLVLSDEEVEEILDEMKIFEDGVKEWSSGNIELDLHIIEYKEPLDLSLQLYVTQDENGVRYGNFWVAPYNYREAAVSRLGDLNFVPDFNLIVPPIRDPDEGIHHGIPACGLATHFQGGIAGAGGAWIPKTASSYGWDCALSGYFGHEWLHQVFWAYQELSGFDDLYVESIYEYDYPPCGKGHRNPKKWFPDTHHCHFDPDFERCGEDYCGPGEILYTHILTDHWDPKVDFIANHCKNGKQDYGETGVDVGGLCLSPGDDNESDKASAAGSGNQPPDNDDTVIGTALPGSALPGSVP